MLDTFLFFKKGKCNKNIRKLRGRKRKSMHVSEYMHMRDRERKERERGEERREREKMGQTSKLH